VRGRVGTPWGQYVGLLVLAAATVLLCYLALSGTFSKDSDGDGASDPGVTSTPTDGTSTPTDDPSETDSSPSEPTQTTSVPPAEPPAVPDQRRKDFTAGDRDLPDGARSFNTDGNVSGMALTKAGLTHGQPVKAGAGLVEVELEGDVQSLGFRVRFASKHPGSAALIGSKDSVVSALNKGQPQPATGMRLIVSPGEWSLSVDDVDEPERTIGQGTYERGNGPATFRLVRSGATVWVFDPTGARTQLTDPAVEELAGPWAAWGLLEQQAGQNPAVIEALWGG
jgi:hypothetical protein